MITAMGGNICSVYCLETVERADIVVKAFEVHSLHMAQGTTVVHVCSPCTLVAQSRFLDATPGSTSFALDKILYVVL